MLQRPPELQRLGDHRDANHFSSQLRSLQGAPVNLQEVPTDMKVTGRANPRANEPALSTGR